MESLIGFAGMRRQTWGEEKWAGFGKIGEFLKRVIWRRLGRAYDWTFRFMVTDPVKVAIFGAWIEAG